MGSQCKRLCSGRSRHVQHVAGVNSTSVPDDSRTASALKSNNEITNVLRNVSNTLDDTDFVQPVSKTVNIAHESAVNASTAKSMK